MQKTVSIIHGGISHERERSLEYGKKVSKILQELGMNVLEMHLHPNGSWTVNGSPENIEQALKKVDAVWNCLVGQDGESGIVENLCAKCKVKLVGHNLLQTFLSADKQNLKHALNQHKIKSAHAKVLYKKDYSKENLLEIFKTVPIPAVVKPLDGSGAWGVYIVNNFAEMERAVEILIKEDRDILVEKLIPGISVSCFVYEHNSLLTTNIKIHDDTSMIGRDELMTIRNDALYIHNCLAYDHHVEYDFILSPNKGLFFIEANTHPDLNSGYIKDVFKTGPTSLKEYIYENLQSKSGFKI